MADETAKRSILVQAPPKQVWDALVDPVAIKKYFMGKTVKTDWKVGSPISWSGEWQGKHFSDKGEILEYEASKVLSYSHWSPLTGADDRPENYHVVTTTPHKHDRGTTVVLTQSNLAGGVSAADRDSRADTRRSGRQCSEASRQQSKDDCSGHVHCLSNLPGPFVAGVGAQHNGYRR